MLAMQVAWITPSELFTPAYGGAIGAFILQRHAAIGGGQPLRIVEVGGGNGTLAADVLVRSSHHKSFKFPPPSCCEGSGIWKSAL